LGSYLLELSISGEYLDPDSFNSTEISNGLGICSRMELITSSSTPAPAVVSFSRLFRKASSSGFFPDEQLTSRAAGYSYY
jgi:hypothetical protein